MMAVICSWCKILIRILPDANAGMVSHGICAACLREAMEAMTANQGKAKE